MTKNNIVICRLPFVTDGPRILELLQAKAKFDGDVSGLELTLADLERDFIGPEKKGHVLLAKKDRVTVGIATYDFVYSTFKAAQSIWLDDLFVDSDYRSLGIGLLLIQELAKIAEENGCKRIDWIVAKDNALGQAFYRRHGAKILDSVYLARFDSDAISNLK